MKTKLLLPLLLISMSLMSCDALDEAKCKQSVQKFYPDAEVITITGDSFKYLVVDKDSTIYFVKTMNLTNTNISSFERIYSFKKKH